MSKQYKTHWCYQCLMNRSSVFSDVLYSSESPANLVSLVALFRKAGLFVNIMWKKIS